MKYSRQVAWDQLDEQGNVQAQITETLEVESAIDDPELVNNLIENSPFRELPNVKVPSAAE